MTLEDRLSTHLKDTSAKLSGPPPPVRLVVAAAGTRRLPRRLAAAGAVLAAGLVLAGTMSLTRSDDPNPPTRVVVTPYAELAGRRQLAGDEVVFTVTADTPSYWRMASLDFYDNGTWKVSGSFSATAPSIDREATGQGDRQTIRQDVEIVSLDAIWLPAASEPVELAVDGGFSVTVDPVTNAMTVPNDRLDSDGLRYSVVSSTPVPTPDQLRNAPRADADTISTIDTAREALPAEIRVQAQELTAGLPSDYDKVIALLDHLRSLDVADAPEPPPDGTDPAVHLLQTGEGSSDEFASALALLARALGIPSRVAVGFTPGEPLTGLGPGTAKGRVTFEVTNHDAHAWTEIYFEGIGWVGFEPTPVMTMPLADRYTPTP